MPMRKKGSKKPKQSEINQYLLAAMQAMARGDQGPLDDYNAEAWHQWKRGTESTSPGLHNPQSAVQGKKGRVEPKPAAE